MKAFPNREGFFDLKNLKTNTNMKVPKSILQAMAVAVAVTTVTACAVDGVSPKDKEKKKNEQPYNCPACGMG